MERRLSRYHAVNFHELIAMRPYITKDRKFIILVSDVYERGSVRYEAYLPSTGEKVDLTGTLNLWEFFTTNLPVVSLDEISKVPNGSEFAKDFRKKPTIHADR